MRTHKYRAWDKKDKMMRSVLAMDWQTNSKDKRIEIKGSVSHINCKSSSNFDTFYGKPIWEVELMESTGLKDRNGKDVFDGDLLKDGLRNIGEVRWNYDRAGFYIRWSDSDIGFPSGQKPERIEIIGNIWENPELLK